MTKELCYLVLVVVLTGLLWVPYILDRIKVEGLTTAVGYPENAKPQSAWAQRLMKAHYNAVENLVLFAPLVFIAHIAGVSNEWTIMACAVYFWARLVHAVSYTFAVPWLRTLSFAAGWFACAVLVYQLLSV